MYERIRRHAKHRDTTAALRLSCLPLKIQRNVPPARRALSERHRDRCPLAFEIHRISRETQLPFCRRDSHTTYMRDSSPLNDRSHTSRLLMSPVSDHQTPAPPHAHPEPAFLRIKDVMRVTALSRPTLYRRIAAQRFPRPVHLGGRACGWASSDLAVWIRDPEGYRTPDTPNVRPRAPAPRPLCRGRPLKYPEFRGR